ncbi:alpha/beta fold hydrolase [Vibrio sp. ZSDE26]|uniref:Alpha/beta fold hydrolase n=1 Tax=Vibrio amylolyticus TaxID=2847292 RepID=A0A9X1XJU5_9VIBR|nr:alpha/beta fold hydrolase [Vibrio amylolyticus]MCK6264582.1 alpha/beta fold hydrolase [Vibrio amylolyticus]
MTVITLASHAETIVFKHGNTILSGQYLKPTDDKDTKGVILFVHGDGATSYDAEGYYKLIWQPLRQNGYAIFSWDKPGVGQSTGNWLEQSMTERQDEVLAAIEVIQEKYGFNADNTGLLGFSQAGWVVPTLAGLHSKIGFFIGIGFATNWVDQGRYFTRVKHTVAGGNANQIEQAILSYNREIDFLSTSPSYAEYVDFVGSQTMIKERFHFVLDNVQSDATQDYERIKTPGLLLWGDDDLNVNAKKEFESWKTRQHPQITAKLIPNATHSMLDSELFNTQEFGYKQWLMLMWYEQQALADTFIPTLVSWLEEHHK